MLDDNSRVKTLVPLVSVDALNGLAPDAAAMEPLCEQLGSTGLYPFAAGMEPGTFHARQFPKSAGYLEDAATGIAATALAFGLKALGLVSDEQSEVTIRQGEAMARPSQIEVSFANGCDPAVGCWLTGTARLAES